MNGGCAGLIMAEVLHVGLLGARTECCQGSGVDGSGERYVGHSPSNSASRSVEETAGAAAFFREVVEAAAAAIRLSGV